MSGDVASIKNPCVRVSSSCGPSASSARDTNVSSTCIDDAQNVSDALKASLSLRILSHHSLELGNLTPQATFS